MTTLQILSHVQQLQVAFSALWMGLSEVLTAAAMLWLLNQIAAAIRLTYSAGLWTGYICKRFVVPAILWTADTISWLHSKVDWEQVRDTLIRVIAAVVAATLVLSNRVQTWTPVVSNWIRRLLITTFANFTVWQMTYGQTTLKLCPAKCLK